MHHDQQILQGATFPGLQGLADWGLNEVAYIKAENIDGARVHMVHAANGENLAAADSAALAAALIIQNGMTPVLVH